jgi:hypothetical protein
MAFMKITKENDSRHYRIYTTDKTLTTADSGLHSNGHGTDSIESQLRDSHLASPLAR